MTPLSRAFIALGFLAGSLPARADDTLKILKAGAAAMPSKAGSVATEPPKGKLAPKQYQQKIMEHALKDIERQKATIALFVSDYSCRMEGGKKARVTQEAVMAKAKELAPKVEVVLLPYDEMKYAFTGAGHVPWGIGICGEGRAIPGFPALAGKSASNVLIVRTEKEIPPPIEGPDGLLEYLPKHTLGHELLHILLNQFGVPALGGGAKKAECISDKRISNLHHRLTRSLAWGQFGDPWRPPAERDPPEKDPCE